MSESTESTDASEENIPPRIGLLHALEVTPRRAEMRRLASAGRDVIEHLVTTGASVEQIAEAADQLESVAATLAAFPSGGSYEGFAEAANAGPVFDEHRRADADEEEWDPEQFAAFDHSPFIGLADPLSPPMYFQYEPGRILVEVTFGAAYEGPPGCVHGGYVAAAFDELLGGAQSLSGTQGMTARLVVNYRSPTPLGVLLRMEGVLARRDGRKIYCEGRLWADDRLCAEAEGLFISLDPDRFRVLLEERQQRLDGR